MGRTTDAETLLAAYAQSEAAMREVIEQQNATIARMTEKLTDILDHARQAMANPTPRNMAFNIGWITSSARFGLGESIEEVLAS